MVTRDELHRTVKLELDEGRASTVEEAEQLAGTYRLQIHVGADVAHSPTRQAALLTAVNAGARAFLGGVHVTGELDWSITAGWYSGRSARSAVESVGGMTVEQLTDRYPTLIIGTTDHVVGSIALQITWDGWAGGIIPARTDRLAETIENPLAGIVGAGIAVSDAFAHARGSVTAGHQAAGISLWRPDRSWLDPEATGTSLDFLPTRLWLGGLGHLGQAYLWAVGFLPYRDRREVLLMLQDVDRVVEANRSTGLLVNPEVREGLLKTRVAAAAMEALGFSTRVVERSFDDTTRPQTGEPTWMLAGFDNPAARACLGGFDLAVDVGLGSSADDFLGIHVHTFPAAGDPGLLFAPTRAEVEEAEPPAWAVAAAKDRCGVLQLRSTAVGAAFVGSFAAAVGLAEILRGLAGAPMAVVGSMSLNALSHADWVMSELEPPVNPGYQLAAFPSAG